MLLFFEVKNIFLLIGEREISSARFFFPRCYHWAGLGSPGLPYGSKEPAT